MSGVHASETTRLSHPAEGVVVKGRVKWVNSKGMGAISADGYVDGVFIGSDLEKSKVVLKADDPVSYSVKKGKVVDIKVLN